MPGKIEGKVGDRVDIEIVDIYFKYSKAGNPQVVVIGRDNHENTGRDYLSCSQKLAKYGDQKKSCAANTIQLLEAHGLDDPTLRDLEGVIGCPGVFVLAASDKEGEFFYNLQGPITRIVGDERAAIMKQILGEAAVIEAEAAGQESALAGTPVEGDPTF